MTATSLKELLADLIGHGLYDASGKHSYHSANLVVDGSTLLIYEINNSYYSIEVKCLD